MKKKIKNEKKICAFRINENSQTDCLYTEGLLYFYLCPTCFENICSSSGALF
jgi:hypothetical protein